MNKIQSALLGVSLVFGLSASADENKPESEAKSQSKHENINLFSDCGIGAALFPETPFAAVSSNIIWDWGTTATSTFLSTPESCKNRAAKVAVLINDTYKNFEEETVVGSGSHLTAMMDIMECDTGIRNELVNDIRADFKVNISKEGFDKKSHVEKANDYYQSVIKNVEFSYHSQCNLG